MLLTMWKKRGLKAGREEGKFEVAKKLLKRGMSFEDIRIITGLSNARINALKKKKTKK